MVFSTGQARAALGDESLRVNKILYRLTRKRWLECWRAEVSRGGTLLDPRCGRQGAYDSDWNLRVNVSEGTLLVWQHHG